MNASATFYLCPTCFYASDIPNKGHEHKLLCVDSGPPGDERRKPITDGNGRILSPAPHWFHETIILAKTAPQNL